MSATGLMHTRIPLWKKSQNQEATRALVSLSPTHWNTGELDSNIYSTIDSTKDRFVSKIRRFLGRDDMGRRLNSPNWFSSLSDRFFLFYSILFRLSLFQQATRTANTRPVFICYICYIQNALIQCFLISFLPGQFSEALVYEVIRLSRLVHITILFTPVHIHATYKNYTDMIDNKIWKKKKILKTNFFQDSFSQ